MSRVSPAVRAAVRERSGGICEVCGCAKAVEQHHRRPRAMGSTKRPETNQAANLLDACSLCHRLAESNRLAGLAQGLLVSQACDPASAPVLYRGMWVLLDNNGGITVTEEIA